MGGKDVGSGGQEIKALLPNKRIDTELRLKEPMETTSEAWFLLEEQDQMTKVIWGLAGNFSYPMNLLMPIMNMDKWIGENYEKGFSKPY